jgi:hypothetical protein
VSERLWMNVEPVMHAETRVIYDNLIKRWVPFPVSIQEFLNMMPAQYCSVVATGVIPPGDEWCTGVLSVWAMPFHHTKYMSQLTGYHTQLLERYGYYYDLRLLIDEMYGICRTIANERKTVRLQAMRNK